MRLAWTMLLLVLLTPVVAAQSYTVSSGSLPTTYSDISGGTTVSLAASTLSSAIAPSGFSFGFFGQTYNSFKIGAGGYLILGNSGTVTGKFASHSTAPGLVVSPLWSDLNPGAYLGFSATLGVISWRFGGGILGVEWRNIPSNSQQTVGVRMKVLIDTATGAIEFNYGTPNGGAGMSWAYTGTCAISGPTATSPQEIIAGDDGTYIKANGQVSAYPDKRFVIFTPTTSPAPSPKIEVRETNASGLLIANGSSSTGGTARDFGNRDVNAGPGTALTIFFHNTGSATLNVGQPSLTGTDAGDFTLSASGFPVALGVGQSHTFTLAFDPGSSGTKSATVNFTHDDTSTSTPFTFAISGNGTAEPLMGVSDLSGTITAGATAAGTVREFGNQDTTSGATAAITITIGNTGSASLNLSNISVAGDSGDFVLGTGSFANVVNAGSTTSFTIAFDPATTGAKAATIEFTHNDPFATNPFTFQVTGIGTAPAVPVLVVRQVDATGAVIVNGAAATGILAFGSLDLTALPAGPVTVFVQNAGSGSLNLGTPASTSTDFVVNATGWPATLAGGQSGTFNVTFAATSVGAKSAQVSFSHNDFSTSTPFVLNFSGTVTTTTTPPVTPPALGGSGGGGGGGCASGQTTSGLAALLVTLFGVAVTRTLRRRASTGPTRMKQA